jgi:antitoxin HicB
MTGDRHYSLSFPDLENCFTDGETLIEAVEMAQDALGLLLSRGSQHTPIFSR